MPYIADMQTFGARLRAARNALGMTQGRLGELIGVTGSAVSRWESDTDQPQLSMLPGLRQILHVSLDHLICGVSERAHGIAEPREPYNLIDESEKLVLAALRRMPTERRKMAIAFIAGEK